MRRMLLQFFQRRRGGGGKDHDQPDPGTASFSRSSEEASEEERRPIMLGSNGNTVNRYTDTTTPRYQAELEEDSDDDSSSSKDHYHPSSWKRVCLGCHKGGRYSFRRGTMIVVCSFLLTLLFASNVHWWWKVSFWFSSSKQRQQQQPPPVHHEVIPTLLSVVDPDTYQYVYALDNPLYLQLQRARFESSFLEKEDTQQGTPRIREVPQLNVDQTRLQRLRGPLTLSWTLGRYRDGSPIVVDDDVFVLDCGETAEFELKSAFHSFQQFRDAATVAQARATSLHHSPSSSSSSDNEWYFARFHVLRDEACQFRLYRQQPTTGQPTTNLRHRRSWWRPFHREDTKDEEDSPVVYTVLAESPVFYLEFVTSPTAIHLALTNYTDAMMVNFVTGGVGTPVALYGTSEDAMTKVSGTSDTYAATDLCDAPANITEPGKFVSPGQLHTIRLTGLVANTTYQYKVGLAHGQGITWSETFRFTSPPPVGSTEPFSFLAYGDQGCPKDGWSYGAAYTTSMATREVERVDHPIRMVHHFGDLSYAQGAAHQWDEWFDMIQNFTTRVPLMVSVGNHEYDHIQGGLGRDPSGVNTPDGFRPVWGNFENDSGGECGVPTSRRFTMPESETSNGVFWYSYDYASVHTTVISSEHDLSPGSPQHTWLENDLRSVNRTLTPWVVVESHRPLYEAEASWENNAVGIAMRYEMEDLLIDYKVDLVLAGHYHAYHRSCAGLYRSKCNNGGPTHITVGSAGAHLDELPLFRTGWTAHFISGEFGYGRITPINASALHFEFVKAGDKDDTSAGEVHDDVWIWH